MTSEVAARGGAATDAIKRIGAPLVIASVLGSTLGIVIAQFLDDVGDGVLAEILGGEAVLYNNRLDLTGADNVAWAGGFILCLLVGFIALFSYPTARDRGIGRLTMLWVILHVLRQAFTQALLLPLDEGSDLALAYNAMDEPPPGLDVVIAAGGGVGLLLVGLAAAAAFLAFAPHDRLISTGRRRFSLAIWIALLPAAVSVFLAIPFFVPDQGSGVIPALPLTALMFLATIAAAPGTTTVQGPQDTRETQMPWGVAATLVVILLICLLILRDGIQVDPTQWG